MSPHNTETANGKSMPNGKGPPAKDPKSTATPSLVQSTSRKPEAIALLGEFAGLLEKAAKYAAIYADFGKILDQVSRLELQIADKNTEVLNKDAQIAQLKACNKANLDTYQDRYTEWDNDRRNFRVQIMEVEKAAERQAKINLKEQETKFREEIQRLKTELGSERKKSAMLESKRQTAENAATRQQREVGLAKAALEEWESKISILKEISITTLLVRARGYLPS
jgi:chromosome segregation ATPase